MKNLEVFDDTELAIVVAIKNIVGQLGLPFQQAADSVLDRLCSSEINMPVFVKADFGAAIRKMRREDGLTLADAAALCGVGYRFMSDLENGKATAQLGKVLQVLTALGLDVYIEARNWPDE